MNEDLEKYKKEISEELEKYNKLFLERLKEYKEWYIKQLLKEHIFRTQRYIYNLN